MCVIIFVGQVKTQQVDQFKEVTAGVDRLYSIPSTSLQHQGTYQCEIYSGQRSIVRLYYYLTGNRMTTSRRKNRKSILMSGIHLNWDTKQVFHTEGDTKLWRWRCSILASEINMLIKVCFDHWNVWRNVEKAISSIDFDHVKCQNHIYLVKYNVFLWVQI